MFFSIEFLSFIRYSHVLLLTNYLFLYLFFLSFLTQTTEILSDSIFRSTGYKCVGEFTRLECESDKMIIVTRVLSRRSTLNFNCSVFDGDNDDISEFDYDFKDKCNGGTTCQFKLPQGKHLFGQYKSTANFESNRINIIYSCVPSEIYLF